MGAFFVCLSPSFADPAPAAPEPTMGQIHDAAASGHLDQAQQMITQVLANHPSSGKAHYVQAEIYAKEGNIPMARVELGIAERLNPGLTAFDARSVQELKSQLGLTASGARNQGSLHSRAPGAPISLGHGVDTCGSGRGSNDAVP